MIPILSRLLAADTRLHSSLLRRFPAAFRVIDSFLERLFSKLTHAALSLIVALVLVVLVNSGRLSTINATCVGAAWAVAVLWLSRMPHAKRLPIFTRTIYIFGLAGLLAAASVRFLDWSNNQPKAPHATASTSSPGIKHGPLSLHELFSGDFFDGHIVGVGFAPHHLTLPNGDRIQYEVRLLFDPASATKFVSVYIPPSKFEGAPYETAVVLASSVEDVAQVNNFGISSEDDSAVNAAKYRFSGRVYIYHDDELSIGQEASLHQIYEKRNMQLELRGQEYQRLEELRRETGKDIQNILLTPYANERFRLVSPQE